jgi:hypothetical protein
MDVGEDLVEITAGDRARARVLRESLRRLADGAGGAELQEMARDVVDGRVEFRTAMLSSAYSAAILEKARSFATWFDDLSSDEREAQVALGREALRNVQEQLDREGSDERG